MSGASRAENCEPLTVSSLEEVFHQIPLDHGVSPCQRPTTFILPPPARTRSTSRSNSAGLPGTSPSPPPWPRSLGSAPSPLATSTPFSARSSCAKQRFALTGDAPVLSCYEAGRDGFWLHRYLEHHAVTNLVVDAASIEVNRRARRAYCEMPNWSPGQVRCFFLRCVRFVASFRPVMRYARRSSDITRCSAIGRLPSGRHRQRRGPKPGGQRNLDPRIGRERASRHGDCQHHGGRGPAVRVRSTQVKC